MLFQTVLAYISDCLSLVSISEIYFIVLFIKDPEAQISYGVGLVCIFFVSIIIGTILRQKFFLDCELMGMRMRKISNGILYNKVTKITLKSLAKTSPAKFMSLMAYDIAILEKIAPGDIINAVLINITCFLIIGFLFGKWIYVAFAVAIWFVLVSL